MVRFLMWCRHKLAVAIPRIIQITIVGHQTAPLFWRAPITTRIRMAAWRLRMRISLRRSRIRPTVRVLLSTESYPNWLQGNSKDYPYYNIIF